MTRGTLIAIVGTKERMRSDNYELLVSSEFNGWMNPNEDDSYGFKAFNELPSCSTKEDFREFIKTFNAETLEYDDVQVFEVEAVKMKWNRIWEYFENDSSLDDDIEEFSVNSDYVYWLNCSNQPSDILLKSGVYSLLDGGIVVTDSSGELAKGPNGEYLYFGLERSASLDWPNEEWRFFLKELDEEDARFLADQTSATEIISVWDGLYDFGYEESNSLGVPDDFLPYLDCEKYARDVLRDKDDVIELPSGKVVAYA